MKADKIEYSTQLIHELLIKSIERFSWLKISVNDFLHDITHAVPFIQLDGNEYKWVHKTFMEYFASCFICYDNKEREEDYFNKMIYGNSGVNYFNVLNFCYDLDILGFRKYAIMPYLKQFIKKSEPYQSESILSDNLEYKNLLIQLLAYEVEVRFLKTSWKISDDDSERKFIELMSKFRAEIENDITMSIRPYEGHVYLFIYKDINRDIYKILIEKIPEIVEQMDLNENNLDITMDIEYDFNEIMEEFTKDNVFFNIAKCVFATIFQDNRILICDKCKEIVKEIERENSFANFDIFDL